jgi:hypothetical protein
MADNHAKSHLLAKFYFRFKQLTNIARGARKLAPFVERGLQLSFSHWRTFTGATMESMLIFQQTRENVLKLRVFHGWKQEMLNKKVASLFFSKWVLKSWWHSAMQSRLALPRYFCRTTLQRRCLRGLQRLRTAGWHTRRARIIGRQLIHRHHVQLTKLGLAGLLDNVLRNKK